MNASIRNSIRSVEPQIKLKLVVEKQKRNFLERKQEVMSWNRPVSPNMEMDLAALIIKARHYQQSVYFVTGTQKLEETFVRSKDASVRRRIVISSDPHTSPLFCAYSSNGDGFSWLHCISFICHGSDNLHKFIADRHLYSWLKHHYKGIYFPFPAQADVHRTVIDSQSLEAAGNNL